jgi:hypothetical protein
MKVFLVTLVLFFSGVAQAQLIPNPVNPNPNPLPAPAPGAPGLFYNWGRGIDGTGYCYQFFANGVVANYGHPVPYAWCEAVQPSYFTWVRGYDGFNYCYQLTPQGLVLNQGRFVAPIYCGFR